MRSVGNEPCARFPNESVHLPKPSWPRSRRSDLPDPATLSRYLAALDQPCVEALRTLFLEDLLARSPFGSSPGGLCDRLGGYSLPIAAYSTKQAARPRRLPATPEFPPPPPRFDRLVAPGHLAPPRGMVTRQ